MNNEAIVVERTYEAAPEKVWRAITDKDQMKSWYFDLAEFRPEVGFEFSFEGGPPERSYIHRCRVAEVLPMQKLSYSWRYEGYEGNSLVTFELFPEGTGTRLKLTHAGLETFPSNPDFARKNFVEGWNDIIGSLLKRFVDGRLIKLSAEISATPEKVWDVLFGPGNTRKWASAFFEGTTAETDWQPGSTVVWTDGTGGIGAKGLVVHHVPASRMALAYWDDVNASEGTPLGSYTETFTVATSDGTTTLTIETGPLSPQYLESQTPMWTNALELIRRLSEQS